MKAILFFLALFSSSAILAEETNDALLKEFHNMGITHCDDFILKNTQAQGQWKFFMNKHAGGIDGPSTEVSLVQIFGSLDKSYKTDYSFIQTLKQCFMHKKGQITVQEPCSKAVNTDIWNIQYNLPTFAYKRYKDKKGIILYSKDLGENSCLLEYEFRTVGDHSIYKPIE